MATRKDIILNKARKQALKVTDIDKIFTRWCDINDYRVIFDYRNEYSCNYKLTQMYNLDNLETGFDKSFGKKHNDPDYKLSQKPTKRIVGRQLVNIDFEDPNSTPESVTILNEIDLYCNEKITSSNGPEASLSNLSEDPFAESDDERDKDYLPDDDLNSTIRPIEKQNCQRGKYNRKNKFDRDLMKSFITEIYNPSNSHHRREHAPNRLYLPSDITITLMHNSFCKRYPEQQVGFEVFRKVVRDDMNISFAHLGNEECEVCTEFEQNHKHHEVQNETCDFCKNFAFHKSRYRESRKSYKDDVKKSESATDTIYFSVDLQKVIMLPRMDQFKRSIFCSRIIAFNESYVPLGRSKKNNVPFAVVWHEGITGRKQEDIISALNAFLLHNRDARHIVLWMDNCSAQNKNWAILSFLVNIINSNDIRAETIRFKYLEPGHTFMSADSFHHQVEQAMQRKNKLYDFQDFVNAVREANSGKCLVKIMEFDDFYNYVDLSSQQKLRKMEPRIYLKDIMEIQATRGDYVLRYKISHFDDETQILDFLQVKCIKTKTFPEFKRKSSPTGILRSTKQDIINKLLPLMPKNRQAFWLDLPIREESKI